MPICVCLAALQQHLARFVDCSYSRGGGGCRGHHKRSAICTTITTCILVRSLETLADFEHAVDDNSVDAFVALQLMNMVSGQSTYRPLVATRSKLTMTFFGSLFNVP